MKKEIKLGFDPLNSGIKALKNELGLILWVTWKIGHITNQCFNKEVEIISSYIYSKNVDSEIEFVSLFYEAYKINEYSYIEYPSIVPNLLSWRTNKEDRDKFEKYLKQVFKYWKKIDTLTIIIEE